MLSTLPGQSNIAEFTRGDVTFASGVQIIVRHMRRCHLVSL